MKGCTKRVLVCCKWCVLARDKEVNSDEVFVVCQHRENFQHTSSRLALDSRHVTLRTSSVLSVKPQSLPLVLSRGGGLLITVFITHEFVLNES